ncbi:MAG: response regulator [Chitinivibrionales bacterium]|nr:response regulator [Chitinivibrionales bacterium]
MGEAVRKKVLVVDDDRSIREYLHYLLDEQGYDVDEAENGVVALQRFSNSHYDVVITDISMPEKDGIDTIIEMRDKEADARIIAMSGVARSETLLEIAKMYKADMAIKKPFQSDELLAALREVLGDSR